MARTSPVVAYTPQAQPQLAASSPIYIKGELQAISTTLASIQTLLPQAATQAPSPLVDGMIRLARSPFYPVSGQATDAWVFYDAKLGSWQYLDTTASI